MVLITVFNMIKIYLYTSAKYDILSFSIYY